MTSTHILPDCTGQVFDCNSTIPTCRNSARFDFISLWQITQDYARQCPGGPWLFRDSNNQEAIATERLAFTNEVCKVIAQADATRYPGGDVWQRLTMWKFPLFQLVVNSPRPPLGFMVEAFTVAHFLGDPIGTISDLLSKIHSCQNRAVAWQDALDGHLSLLCEGLSTVERQRLWKSFAIIVDSFDEWGTDVGDRAHNYLLMELSQLCADSTATDIRQQYTRTLLQTADALAADRSTKFLPVIIAQSFFIGSVAIAMIHTKSSSNRTPPKAWTNIEMYSIAFTAQYFWVIFAVVLSSIIGTSQTSAALPRILGRCQRDLEREVSAHGLKVNLPIRYLAEERRIYHGGIYSWQPKRRGMAEDNSALERRARRRIAQKKMGWIQRSALATVLPAWQYIRRVLPFFVVAAGAGTGQLLSALVPPIGWSCRSDAMMWMFLTWITSWGLSFGLSHTCLRLHFWLTYVKDVLAVSVTSGIIIATQLGIYNSCDCYTHYGLVGVQLPTMTFARDLLKSRLDTLYPFVVIMGIMFQLLIVPGLLVWRYHAAVQVFLQRDDGGSNIQWWYSLLKWREERKYTAVQQQCKSRGPAWGVAGLSKDEETHEDLKKLEVITVVEVEHARP